MTDVLSVPATRAIGLRVIGVSFLAQLVASGVTTYSFGYFLKPITEEFGASRSAVSLGQSIFMLAAAVLLPPVGRLMDARPLRGLIVAGSLLMGAGLAGVSQITALWQAGLLAGAIALGTSLCGSLAGSALVVRAFTEGRQRALGLASLGTSAGGALLPPIAVGLIEAHGWRGALALLGVGSGLLLALTAALAVPMQLDRPAPQDARGAEKGSSWSEVLRSRNFWPITLPMMVIYASNTALIGHLPALASDQGIPAARAALLVPSMALASLAGKLVYAAAADRFDARAPLWLATAVLVPALLLVLIAPRYEFLLAMAVANGLGTGSLLPAWSGLVARCFGTARFAAVMGLSRLCTYPLIATGGLLAGLSKDLTGSYDPVFQGFLAAALLVALLPFRMRIPARV
jgi:MFS family permease